MSSVLYDRVVKINEQIAAQLVEARRALAGQGEFQAENVRALSDILGEMAPIMNRADILKNLEPEIAKPLEIYKTELRELQRALERVQMMLMAKKTQLENGRGQLEAMTKWAAMLSQTR